MGSIRTRSFNHNLSYQRMRFAPGSPVITRRATITDEDLIRMQEVARAMQPSTYTESRRRIRESYIDDAIASRDPLLDFPLVQYSAQQWTSNLRGAGYRDTISTFRS